MVRIDLIVANAGELVTVAGGPIARAGRELAELGIVEDGAVAVTDGLIVATGSTDEITSNYAARHTIDAAGGVVMPGFVDPHNHIVWAGSREAEFELRIKGASYMEIAEAGGGIINSVKRFREASLDDLLEVGRARLKRMLGFGVTTTEAKSGYGLSTESELRALEAINILDGEQPIDLVPTFLGAHDIPEEFKGRTDEYVDLVVNEMIPAVADKNLAEFCDVFTETGWFDVPQSERVLKAGLENGMRPKVHAEELSFLGGAEMAARLGAVSADHLIMIEEPGIRALAASDTVAVLLPGVSFFLGMTEYAPARAMIEAGVKVALATDCNPGSSMVENIQLILTLACLYLRMTPAETLTAVTINAAHAIGRGDSIGSLETGKQADIIIFDVPNHRSIPYYAGSNFLKTVIKKGEIVLER